MDDLHKILQVRPGADDETIAAAYARLRRRYDPALGGPFADPSALREVERAYAVLSDPETRDAYEMGRLRPSELPEPRTVESSTPPPITPAARDPFGLESHRSSGDQRSSVAPTPRLAEDRLTTPPATASPPPSSEVWRAPSESGPSLPELEPGHASETIPLSPPVVPHRQKAPSWRKFGGWRGAGIVPIAAVIFVLLGAGLAAWGVAQAITDGEDDTQTSGIADRATEPAAEDESNEPAGPAAETLAPPEVASSDALPDELADFATDVIEEYEDDEGRTYRVYNFVATLTGDGELFYAAIAIAEESDLVGQAIFFFIDDEFIGTDWEEPVRSVESIASISGGQIRVVYRVYAEDDEDCCPSGQPFDVVYTYEGGFASDNANPPDGIFAD